MLYKDIKSMLGALSTTAEKIRKLSSATGDSDEGIVDGVSGTEVNKSYMERDAGIYDVIVALYNVFSGVDDLSSTNVTIGTTVFSSSAFISTGTAAMYDVNINNDLDVAGASTLAGLTASASSYFEDDLIVDDRIGYSFMNTRGTTDDWTLGESKRVFLIEEFDCVFRLPDEFLYYHGSFGGSFRFESLDDTAMVVTASGSMHLGLDGTLGPGTVTGNAAPGIFIHASDAKNSLGQAIVRAHSLPADDRADMGLHWLAAIYNAAGALAGTAGVYMTARTTPANSTWEFTSVIGAPAMLLAGSGDATFNGEVECSELDVNGAADISGAMEVHGFSTLSGGAAISGTLGVSYLTVDNDAIFGNVISDGLVRAYSGTDKVEMETTADYAVMRMMMGTSIATIGIDAITVGGLGLSPSNGDVVIYRGASAVRTGRADLHILGDSSTDRPSIFFSEDELNGTGTYRMFVDSDGVVSVTDVLTGSVGPQVSGAVVAKAETTSGSVDITNQPLLNAYCNAISAPILNAVVVIRNSVDTFLYQAILTSGGNWEIIH